MRLLSLNISTYNDAKKIINRNSSENVIVNNKKFKFSFIGDEYPDSNEIVIAAYLVKEGMFCGESYSSGYCFNKNNVKSYLSQKALWNYGY